MKRELQKKGREGKKKDRGTVEYGITFWNAFKPSNSIHLI